MTDALRFNAGKVPMSYAPAALGRAAARGFQYGAEFKPKPYPRDNWRKGFNYSSVIDSFMRHLDAWREGEDVDPETAQTDHPLSHLDLMACNLAMLCDMAERGIGVDDRPRLTRKEVQAEDLQTKTIMVTNFVPGTSEGFQKAVNEQVQNALSGK